MTIALGILSIIGNLDESLNMTFLTEIFGESFIRFTVHVILRCLTPDEIASRSKVKVVALSGRP